MKKKLATILCLLFSISVNASDEKPISENIRVVSRLATFTAYQEQRQQLFIVGEIIRLALLAEEAKGVLEAYGVPRK